MGFLENLIKREASKFVSSMVDKAIDNVADRITGNNGDNGNNGNNGSNGIKKELVGEAGLRARLEQVIANEYSTYELKKNVPASEMFAEPGAVDYSYGIYKNGAPVAYITVIADRNEYKLKRFRDAKAAAEARGIPHMNFFAHLPNETSYISERLKQEISK